MPTRVPQLILTLAPNGALQVELPWNGGRRIVSLGHVHGARRQEAIEATLVRMLEAQHRNSVVYDDEGRPVQQQVEHWEKHSIFPNEKCPFCRAEDRILHGGRARARIDEHRQGDGSVRVRRVDPKGKARKLGKKSTTMTLEEIM